MPTEDAARPSTPWPTWTAPVVALGVPVVLFFLLPPLSKSGLWDPYELDNADLARRIALNLMGGADLAVDGANNALPHLNDLARPQLPLTSIAAGFRLAGLHVWAGRAPMALWGLAGVGATYLFVARLFDRRTGVYASLALATMPLYFVQARAMMGDICAMATLAMAFGGLAVATFDRDERGPTSLSTRLGWLAMATVGLVAGLESRGALLGVAVPLLGVGGAWLTSRLSTRAPAPDPPGDVIGALALGAGLVVGLLALRVVVAGDSHDLSLWVGAMTRAQGKAATFDLTLGALGHALAPWSAFLPFAVGRSLMAPHGRRGAVAEREGLARSAVMLGLAVAIAAHGLLAAHSDGVAFTAPALCAVVCAVAIRDYERGASSSLAVGLGTLLLAAVLHHDFHEQPEKAFEAYGIRGAAFPETFKAQALDLWWVVLGGFALLALVTWAERDAPRRPFDRATYRALLSGLRDAYDGALVTAYFAAVAGAALAGAAVFAQQRWHVGWLPMVPAALRGVVLNAWWLLAVAPPFALLGAVAVADGWLWAFGPARAVTRAPVFAAAGAACGLVLCAGYYPALADQLSPKDVFETARAACPDSPVGLLGVGGRSAAYYAGGTPQSFSDAPAALGWLTAPGAPRRCLALESGDLPQLNALWRRRSPPPTRTNLPVPDARSSQILLAASQVASGSADQNPLSRFVLRDRPRPWRPLDVDLDGKLRVLGVDVTDGAGHRIEALSAGTGYRLRVYYEVLGEPGEWPNAFIHVDGHNRRHGADHKPLDGRYPMNLWLPGDLVVDDTELKLEPNFGPGTYTLYFGFAHGDGCSDRLAVKSGPSDGCNRVDAGPLVVR